MKTATFIFASILSAGWIALSQQPSASNDSRPSAHSLSSNVEHRALHSGPGMKMEFENGIVQVIRIRIRPHEKIPMHDILTPRVQVLLTDEHLKVTFPNGDSREENHKAGETMWLEPKRHAGENLSDAPLEFITVVPKNNK